MGAPAWSGAAEFATSSDRVANSDALHERIAAWTSGYDDGELASMLQRHGVAAAPVLNVADLLHDAHYRSRGTFIEVEHPLGFRETIYGSYVKMSRSEIEMRPGPVIGQDNERVFKDLLGLSEERYRELVAAEVIY
jgi:benzylsuccinate CoA-transferase BbsF subunit